MCSAVACLGCTMVQLKHQLQLFLECLWSTCACGSLVPHSPWLCLIASSTGFKKQICSSKMPVAKGAMAKVSVSQAVTLNQLLFWTKCPSGALGALLVQNQICRTYSPCEIMRMYFLWKHIPDKNYTQCRHTCLVTHLRETLQRCSVFACVLETGIELV